MTRTASEFSMEPSSLIEVISQQILHSVQDERLLLKSFRAQRTICAASRA
jgi:hypothetical protein